MVLEGPSVGVAHGAPKLQGHATDALLPPPPPWPGCDWYGSKPELLSAVLI